MRIFMGLAAVALFALAGSAGEWKLVWSAIWILGANIREAGWPACGEIDIMEYVGHDPGVVHANVHTRGYNHARGTGRGAWTRVPDAEKTFHVYAVEWTPEKLDFFMDDTKYFTLDNDKTGLDSWPFDAPQYLILNLAIGGAWGGQQGIDDAIFPQRFIIDFVRVYQRPGAGG
ncbi:MAG TPA: glycoside hydrolase family 16 protein [Candidatus Paceibacterota bacterium]|nr:glycoside hydrolase family 16 protein [Verrucomicrobiota bacterium]HRZ44942.1 glycoside hydrolase family 16 protein [Candidatus Paceibacterota bacterium]HRZ92305.1 glycoside hydrolase family 16 protein [Candidatus Paceibacterota bacterium]